MVSDGVLYRGIVVVVISFCKQKTAYGMRMSDWSSDVCSSDLFLPAWRAPAWPPPHGGAGADHHEVAAIRNRASAAGSADTAPCRTSRTRNNRRAWAAVPRRSLDTRRKTDKQSYASSRWPHACHTGKETRFATDDQTPFAPAMAEKQ